jgi:hypothetical protein
MKIGAIPKRALAPALTRLPPITHTMRRTRQTRRSYFSIVKIAPPETA